MDELTIRYCRIFHLGSNRFMNYVDAALGSLHRPKAVEACEILERVKDVPKDFLERRAPTAAIRKAIKRAARRAYHVTPGRIERVEWLG